MVEPEKRARMILNRRNLIKSGIAAGVGIAAAGSGIRLSIEDKAPTPEIILPKFDFDITSYITGSDWKHITAEAKSEKDIYYKVAWRAMLEAIDKEKAQEVSLDDDDLDDAISDLDHLEDRWGSHWHIYLNEAAKIRITFPKKTDRLYEAIDGWNTDINRNFQNITDDIHSPYYTFYVSYLEIPKLGFQFKNILYPEQDVKVDEAKWAGFNNELGWAYQQNYMTLITDSCSRLKHYAPERLPNYYFNEQFKDAQRTHALKRLNEFRSVENWPEVIEWANIVQLNEANSVQMTPGGLVLE